ncbi:amidohydrolase family protein [Glaciibacter psychrotolerans]|uniref:5-methylthioadenosine/S-adenosylhomocysteine deaminase n=1 Tax=Glaciibacter psychrotolerans TaxID=670054 RepID=A0A7Z0EH39_9MICO|nr:amidohydrolase [Leifsonia psychrotolerans]NYJ20792.1 5-methylthioadenosine/S-adenosylhomocysteine deaminase [Leifsonia psychrotolerans]
MTETRESIDLIVRADTILTVDEAGTVITAGAIAINDGVIVGIGDEPQISARYTATEVLDGAGCSALPGWVNTHAHLAMNLFRGATDDVTLETFLDRLIGAERRVLSAETVAIGARAAMAESLLGGTTTALDMYWYPQTSRAVARELGFRLINGPTLMGDVDPEGNDFDAMLVQAERILTENRADAPNDNLWLMPHSAYTLGSEQLRRVSELAARFGARIHTHCAESSGEIALVAAQHDARPLAVLDEAGLVTDTTVLAHAVHLTDDEIATIARIGATVAHAPISNLKIACGIARVPDLLAAGASVALGTDGAASTGSLDMMQTVRMAALLHKGVSQDPTLINAERAVRLGTADGARSLGLTDVGTLAVGMRADIQVVHTDTLASAPTPDPWSRIVYGASASDVRHTVSDGRVVVRDRALLTADEPTILRELAAASLLAHSAAHEG